MKRAILGLAASGLMASVLLTAQGPQPFKLGTFERAGRPFVGIVLRDAVVVDLAAATAAVGTPASRVAAPADMKDLIARYDQGLRGRIEEIVRVVGAAAARPAYVYDLAAVKTLPPIMYPANMINTALNYREHATEMAGLNSGPPALQAGAPPPGTATPNTVSAPGIWERAPTDTRWNPYLFLKSPSAVIANGEAIRLPVGRDQIDWECELGVVIGRTASRVPLAQANDHIFGYTVENDVSDRGGRGDDRYGSDWLIGKSHDTFAPMGPFIVPKEFVSDPRKLKQEIMDPIGASDSWLYLGYDNADVGVDGKTMTSVPGGTRWGGGLWMSTRDHARFGYLMLRNGNWNGRQVVSESWIRQATTPGGVAGNRSYGYMWWLNEGGRWPDVTRSSFAARGDGPNVMWIDPEHDLVVVLRWYRGNDGEFLKRVLAAVTPTNPGAPVAAPGFDVPPDWPEVLTVGTPLPAGGRVKVPPVLNQLVLSMPVGSQPRGDVVLNILIAPDGTVHDATILRGVLPPDMALYEAAIQAAKRRVYVPTIVDGVAHPILLKNAILLDTFACP